VKIIILKELCKNYSKFKYYYVFCAIDKNSYFKTKFRNKCEQDGLEDIQISKYLKNHFLEKNLKYFIKITLLI